MANNTPLKLLAHYIFVSGTKVEVRTCKELLHEPVLICRSEHEKCLIESSINSARISIRFKFEDADPIEKILGEKFLSFMMKRAEDYAILRRIPIDVSSNHLNGFIMIKN